MTEHHLQCDKCGREWHSELLSPRIPCPICNGELRTQAVPKQGTDNFALCKTCVTTIDLRQPHECPGLRFEAPAAPFACKFCGAPSWVDPSDQQIPPDYCHPIDHGTAPALTKEECEDLADAIEEYIPKADRADWSALGAKLRQLASEITS